MPTMYRLGCFRDDIIFLVYVYQRYIYRVDLKRVNEFGVTGEQLEQVERNGSIDPPAEAVEPNGNQPVDKKND